MQGNFYSWHKVYTDTRHTGLLLLCLDTFKKVLVLLEMKGLTMVQVKELLLGGN